jgi:hypothetical protein
MAGYFSIWDITSGNFVAEYDEGLSALRLIAALIEANGSDYADSLDLAWISSEDEARHIATGPALLALISGVEPRRPRPIRTTPVVRSRRAIREVRHLDARGDRAAS